MLLFIRGLVNNHLSDLTDYTPHLHMTN